MKEFLEERVDVSFERRVVGTNFERRFQRGDEAGFVRARFERLPKGDSGAVERASLRNVKNGDAGFVLTKNNVRIQFHRGILKKAGKRTARMGKVANNETLIEAKPFALTTIVTVSVNFSRSGPAFPLNRRDGRAFDDANGDDIIKTSRLSRFVANFRPIEAEFAHSSAQRVRIDRQQRGGAGRALDDSAGQAERGDDVRFRGRVERREIFLR